MTTPATITTALTATEMEEQLDLYLDPVLSFRRSAAGPAAKMAKMVAPEQKFGLHWVKVLAATNAEMAFQFADNFSQAVLLLPRNLAAVEQWIVDAIAAYDERGLQHCIKVLQHPEKFSTEYFSKQYSIELINKNKLLSTFVCGLYGRELLIKPSELTYTDTQTLFLPESISEFSTKEENFLYYKFLTVLLWAQNWYGSWHLDIEEEMLQYDDYDKALSGFKFLETLRLLHKISLELPGFYRQISPFLKRYHAYCQSLNNNASWLAIFKQLNQANSQVQDSFNALKKCYHLDLSQIPSLAIQLFPKKVMQVKKRRLVEEKTRFREALSAIVEEKKNKLSDQNKDDNEKQEPSKFELNLEHQSESENELPQEQQFILELDGQPIEIKSELDSLMSSIFQDLSEIPEDYLFAAGPGKYSLEQSKDTKKEDVWSGTYHEEGAFFYDEWDYIRQHYRKNWCVVREMKVTPVFDDFVQQTLKQHIAVVKTLRRNFEALKVEEKRLKRQITGDDIDLDAVVESYAELSMGMELSEHIFTRMQREDRNIAVMFLVDMSGSTEGWINQLEREALILLCESLELLGDRYAIYGFSGTTRKRCEIYHIKHLDEHYDETIKARISGVQAKDYTRMGFGIRHLNALLEQVDAKTKILISLTDGKPEDYDGQYRGQYGIEDTRKALFESRQKGIHPYCITIDKEAGDYLPYMYGAANYVLIENINKLPHKVADIYRKLTS